ncbi:DUF998 domain-containing protein [Streptomyces zaomyceticus]|uniref:DUF998 domain-containing protein n=1 Tax=Streptomyces zaomyceticus TaxID=68286 RepID=UPI00167A0C29|nr:DUF998 domain-containing protein [Streptomyces zaomyceticus]GHG35086.1 hypothetical protein GCM10018791_60530 [Streptomyces zaomyceticus]
MPGKVTRASAALLALGALAYTAWVLEVLVHTGLDPVRTYVSELAAEDQPLGAFFRATDLVAGALILAGAVTGLLGTGRPTGMERPRRTGRPTGTGRLTGPGRPPEGGRSSGPRRPTSHEPWALAGWIALAVFGAATVADSRLPLSCAATADPACAARESAGLVPATHTAHAASSGLAMTAALVALVALTVAARRLDGRWPLARTGPALVAVELAATVWTLGAVAAFEAGNGTWALGAGQRLQVLLVAVWLAVLAYSLAVSQEER